jgi:hypothetical protein
VDLALDPKGPPVAHVRLDTTEVKVLEDAGGHSRIAAETDNTLVVGWVPSAALLPSSEKALEKRRVDSMLRLLGALNVGTIGTLGVLGSSEPPPEKVLEQLRCPGEVRLLAEVGGDRWLVGASAGGVALRVLRREPTVAYVALPAEVRGGFSVVSPATLAVPARDLASCTPEAITTDPPPPPVPTLSDLSSLNPPLHPPGSLNLPDLKGGPNGVAPKAEKLPEGTVSSGSAVVSGRIDDAESVIRTQLVPAAHSCYRRGLAEDPSQSGRLVLTIRVAPIGEVETTSVAQNSGLSGKVASCISSRARGLHFAQNQGGTINVPLSLVHP